MKYRQLCYRWSLLPFLFALSASTLLAATILPGEYPVDLKEYAHISQAKSKWLEAGSPWSAYVKRPFEEGLSPQDLQRSRASQAAGDCQTVLALEVKGFLALNPDFQSQFSDPDKRRVLETEIIPDMSPAYRRCRARATLLPFVEAAKRRWALEKTYHMTLPRIFERRWSGEKPTPTEMRLETAVATILSLVACDPYEPAFDDLIDLRPELKPLALTFDELNYIQHRAKRAGIIHAAFDDWVSDANDAYERYSTRNNPWDLPFGDPLAFQTRLLPPTRMVKLCGLR